MKKFLALLLAAIMLLLLTACGKGEESTLAGESTEATTNTTDGTQDGAQGTTESTIGGETTETQKPTEMEITAEIQKTIEPQKTTETQKTAHTHSYSKKVTAVTCTEKGYTTYTCSCGDSYTADEIAAKGHFYDKKVMEPTCTEKGYTTYTCACGDAYKDNFINPSHDYVNNVCSRCGAANANYTAYQTEYAQLTNKYNADVTELQKKIATSQSNIEKSQKAISNARGSLASLSSSCPQWFLQQYINNWQAYGDTYSATQAAKNAWTQQYNSQKAQYENVISVNTSKIQTEQTNIGLYNTAISTRTTQYNNDVNALKVKHGLS